MKTKQPYFIISENSDFIVAEKDAGISSIPENDLSLPNLYSLLCDEYKSKLFIVHRLDKDVSGIILFAKNERAHKDLCKLFETREIKKRYSAVVTGLVKNNTGIIAKSIKEFGSGRMGVTNGNSGKRSITNYEVKKCFHNHTLVELTPTTGRRHQLRVHLYSIGHPVAGDRMYGDDNLQCKYKRLYLHASELEFHLDQVYHFKSEVPSTFINFHEDKV
ncbi:hypothetical protein APF79_02725 [bacterium BRH_c32]|nr:MAG: hypothetical protein APF79_02725 [bacterium BRH_c32]